jgi:excisionase family DNA binding protein
MLLRTTRKAVYALIERGQLPGVTRLGRRVLILRSELLEWLCEKRTASPGRNRRRRSRSGSTNEEASRWTFASHTRTACRSGGATVRRWSRSPPRSDRVKGARRSSSCVPRRRFCCSCSRTQPRRCRRCGSLARGTCRTMPTPTARRRARFTPKSGSSRTTCTRRSGTCGSTRSATRTYRASRRSYRTAAARRSTASSSSSAICWRRR